MSQPLFLDERESWQRPDGMTVIARRPFCRDYADIKPGEHIVFGGPTTRGKTTLAFDLLEYAASPTLPAYIAVSKPDDKVTRERGRALDYRFVSDWPPTPKVQEMKLFGGQKPSGYIVWPAFGDLENDMERCAQITGKLLMERYASGANRKKNTGGILVMDDTMVKAKIMGLDNKMVTILAMAGAMKFGLWIFVQKPTDSGRTTLWGYENATHLFFTKGGDARMLSRYVEILGENGPIAKKVIPTLGPFEFLYAHKVHGTMCIVAAS